MSSNGEGNVTVLCRNVELLLNPTTGTKELMVQVGTVNGCRTEMEQIIACTETSQYHALP